MPCRISDGIKRKYQKTCICVETSRYQKPEARALIDRAFQTRVFTCTCVLLGPLHLVATIWSDTEQ
jgi:hypothetical protein